MQLYDDFIELEPGSIERLEQELRAMSTNYGNSIGESINSLLKRVTESFKRAFQRIRPSENASGLQLNRMNRQQTTSYPESTGAISTAPTIINDARSQDIQRLLLCIDQGPLATPLFQERLGYVRTDRELFHFLHSEYFGRWNNRSWWTLRSIQRVSLTRVG